MKLTKKLLPALGMLALSACMLVTSTFAWFAMNENVTASGMSVTAKGDQVYLQILSGSGSNIWDNQDGKALPTATAPDATKAGTILPANVVNKVNATSRTETVGEKEVTIWENRAYGVGEIPEGSDKPAEDYATINWVTNVGKSNSEGDAIAKYSDVTEAANNNNGTYFIKNTFSIRLDPTAGALEAGAPLKVSAISIAAPAGTDKFVGCLSVLVVAKYGSGENITTLGQVWAWDGAKFDKTLGSEALSAGNFTAASPATVDIYVFFNGDDDACTQVALATAQNTAYNVSVSFTVHNPNPNA